ncbi:MAG: DegT/DnrJ/EryC1/StrS family aminotransferase [Planctomycetota bacterium]|nr:DegT/DnrJ/EryC1/StrS family aminotransferase [Planctomycetota bacterium]
MSSANEKPILTAGPSITRREMDYVADAVAHGWNQDWNLYLERFQRAFAEATHTRHAMATSSCTGALHLALAALGVGPGDEVLVPEITWVATASAVAYTGATPVCVDVEADTWCMDPDRLTGAITPRSRVVLPVHLYGQPADMARILPIARSHGLKVLEDAAPALGATVRMNGTDHPVGSLGDAACFSFQGAKIMTTGEGGMLVTSDETIHDRASFLNDHGRDRANGFQILEVGYKYKMSNIQAALGLGQLERLDELVGQKRRIMAWYRERLQGVPGLLLNAAKPWSQAIYWMSSVVLDERLTPPRDQVMRHLKGLGVDSRPFFPPLSSFPMFQTKQGSGPVASRLGRTGINLPSGHGLTEADVDRVCRGLRSALVARVALAS